jgi:hypothetical protein
LGTEDQEVTVTVSFRSALAAFVQQFVYWPDRRQHPAVLTAHPANGGQQLAASSTTPVLVPTTGASSEGLYGIVASGSVNVAYIYPG